MADLDTKSPTVKYGRPRYKVTHCAGPVAVNTRLILKATIVCGYLI